MVRQPFSSPNQTAIIVLYLSPALSLTLELCVCVLVQVPCTADCDGILRSELLLSVRQPSCNHGGKPTAPTPSDHLLGGPVRRSVSRMTFSTD